MDEHERREELRRLAVNVRRNLTALMNRAAALNKRPASVLELEADSGVGKSTIYRILKEGASNDTSMGNLHALARCYGFDGWHLLRDKLNIADPKELEVALAVYHQVTALAEHRGRDQSAPHDARAPRTGSGHSPDRQDRRRQPQRHKAPRP